MRPANAPSVAADAPEPPLPPRDDRDDEIRAMTGFSWLAVGFALAYAVVGASLWAVDSRARRLARETDELLRRSRESTKESP